MHRPEREKDIEHYFCEEIKKRGGIAFKFTSPQRRSVPDRLCVMPNGVIAFVEVKKKGGKLSSGQEREQQRLIVLGHDVYMVWSKDEARVLAHHLATKVRGFDV